jgi:acyl-CoA synthetase (NDP forming)
MDAMRALFHPGSVAIFGSFSSADGYGCQFTRALLGGGYQGQIYPVNPRGGRFEDRLTIHSRLDEVEAPVDLAMIAVGPRAVKSVVEDCARHGVKVGVIFTAGFAEIGEEGAHTEALITALAREAGMRLVGPNCMSVFSAPAAMNLTSNPDIPIGHLGMLSQSGNVALSLWYDAARYNDVGFSKFIGFGNQADIAAHEYLAHLGDDPDTWAVLLYLEGLRPGLGGAFLDVARDVARHKPIVVLKGGRTQAGNRAIQTHTAALATDARVYSAAFRQAGIVEVDRMDELLPVAETLMRCPSFTENKIAAVGSGGGHSIVVVDALERAGFTVPPFSPTLKPDITREIPHWAPWENPIDMTGSFLEDQERWGRLVEVALADPQGMGAALVFGVYGYKAAEPGMAAEWMKASESLRHAVQATGRAIVLYTPYARKRQPYLQSLRQAGIPVYDSVEIAARALRALHQRGCFLARDADRDAEQKGGTIADTAASGVLQRAQARLTEPEAARLLEAYGVPVAQHQVTTSPAEAVEAAESMGYPVVLKVISRDVLHKSDVGGVKANIDSAQAVAAAYEQIERSVRSHLPAADIEGILVSSQVQDGHEIIVGLSRQEPFGSIVMVGLGGVFVEVLEDITFRVLPLSLADVREMLSELKATGVLQGERDGIAADLEALADLILKLTLVAQCHPEIAEIDLNPVFVQPCGVLVADCRVLLRNAG